MSVAPSSSAATTATKRLLHELQQQAQEPNAAFPKLGPVSDDQMLHWEAVMHGPDLQNETRGGMGGGGFGGFGGFGAGLGGNGGNRGTTTAASGYEGGLWKLDVRIPSNYPLAPPEVRFVTPICHPNVHFKTGEICLDLLKDSWTPAYSIERTLDSIRMLLTDPEPESPLNVDVAALLRAGDVVAAAALVRFYTAEHRWRA